MKPYHMAVTWSINSVTTFKTLGDVIDKNNKNYEFWKDMPYNPDFPSIEEIRKQAWPDRWKK